MDSTRSRISPRDVLSNLNMLMLGISRKPPSARDNRDFLRGVVRRKEPLSILAVEALKMDEKAVLIAVEKLLHVTPSTLITRINEIISSGNDQQISRFMILRVLEVDAAREEFKLHARQKAITL